MDTLWSAISEFLVSTKLYVILALIITDVFLAVALAVKNREFDFTRLGDFMATMILPYVISYLVIHVVTTFVEEVSEFLGKGLDTLIFSAIVASLAGAIFDNLKGMGLKLPEVRQANAYKEVDCE